MIIKQLQMQLMIEEKQTLLEKQTLIIQALTLKEEVAESLQMHVFTAQIFAVIAQIRKPIWMTRQNKNDNNENSSNKYEDSSSHSKFSLEDIMIELL